MEKQNKILLQNIEVFKNKEISAHSDKTSVGVQTILFEEDMIRCKECEYPADDIYDLGEHVYEFHGEHEKNSLECHYCDEKFQSKRDLMIHRKEAHIE